MLVETKERKKMSFFACCKLNRSDSIKGSSLVYSKSSVDKKNARRDDQEALATIVKSISMQSGTIKQRKLAEEILKFGKVKVAAEVFTFRQLAAATDDFDPELLLGEGGFGRVYKGHMRTTNHPVAVKQLDRNGLQGNREFLAEVLTLSLVHHPNLVNLIGYCADGHQRILVYEYMSNGSLEDHLFDSNKFLRHQLSNKVPKRSRINMLEEVN